MTVPEKQLEIELPPGFRFHPTDEELVIHYLCRKCASQPLAAPIIKEIDLYKFDPWQLPELALCGEKEWYFFSPRDRKYPNGSRPNRAAGTGYWKATGADKPIGRPKSLAIKKALVFYAGKAPTGMKTNWIMHEYRLANVDRSASAAKNKNSNSNSNSRLDDWVLCRIYNKKGRIEKHYNNTTPEHEFQTEFEEQKPNITMLPESNKISDSIPRDRMHTDSSGASEQVTSPEVQSESRSWGDFDFNFDFNYMDGFGLISDDPSPFGLGGQNQVQQIQFQMDQFSPLQDMISYLHAQI